MPVPAAAWAASSSRCSSPHARLRSSAAWIPCTASWLASRRAAQTAKTNGRPGAALRREEERRVADDQHGLVGEGAERLEVARFGPHGGELGPYPPAVPAEKL